MSVQSDPGATSEPRQEQSAWGEAEVVDAVPVDRARGPLAGSGASRALERRHAVARPAVQAAAAAAGGFVAGAALFGLVQRRQRRAASPARAQRGRAPGRRGEAGGPVGDLIQIVASRSLLVDVHLLAGPGGR